MPPEDSSTPEVKPRFGFYQVVVERAHFEHVELASRAAGEKRPRKTQIDINLGGTIGIDQTRGVADVSLTVKVAPDPKWQPYRVEVVIIGRFKRFAATPEEFDRFCRFGVPPILFPYVRETIDRLTRDGRYGSVTLDPINIQELVRVWKPAGTVQQPPATASSEP